MDEMSDLAPVSNQRTQYGVQYNTIGLSENTKFKRDHPGTFSEDDDRRGAYLAESIEGKSIDYKDGYPPVSESPFVNKVPI